MAVCCEHEQASPRYKSFDSVVTTLPSDAGALEPNVFMRTLSAAVVDKLSESISMEFRAVKASQADLEQQLRQWMSAQGEVLSQVNEQHRQLQKMITERKKVSRQGTQPTTKSAVSSANSVKSKKPKLENAGDSAENAGDKPKLENAGDSAGIETHSLAASEMQGEMTSKSSAQRKECGYGRVRTPSQKPEKKATAAMDRIEKFKSGLSRAESFMEQHAIHGSPIYKKTAKNCVKNVIFDLFFGFLILANATMIGAEVEYKARTSETSGFFVAFQYFFCIMFIFELTVRTIAAGVQNQFCGKDWFWGWFDAVMILISIVEVIDSATAASANSNDGGSQLLKFVRTVRLARIVRVLRFSPQLMVMVIMVLESAKALVYALILLAIILYIFSVCFTMGATDYLKDPTREYFADITKHYGTISRSGYSLFKSVTGGQSWGELSDPLFDMGYFYSSIFIFWISFAVLALLNVVTGFFVDGALAKSAQDRGLIAEKEMARKKAVVQTLTQLFVEGDVDGTGLIDIEEFERHLHDENVAAYLAALKIDTNHLKDLFQEIDADGSGSLDMQEFVENMQHVMGATAIDQNVQRLIMENREMSERWRSFAIEVKQDLSELNEDLSELHDLIFHTLPERLHDFAQQAAVTLI